MFVVVIIGNSACRCQLALVIALSAYEAARQADVGTWWSEAIIQIDDLVESFKLTLSTPFCFSDSKV